MCYRLAVRLLAVLALALLALALPACGQFDDMAHDMAHTPENLICGWTLNRTEQLGELPPGMCWRITSDAKLATTPAGVSACDVETGTKTYAGGEFVDLWGATGPDGAEQPYDQQPVDCATGAVL